jgi:5-methyltetrahydropteroyltriglutamate--homocysteine methyltransferase
MRSPPFRAEHIGSLLRPEKLLKARQAVEGDQYRAVSRSLAHEELREIENDAIRDAVKLQEAVGLDVITDGEFRRRSWYQDFLLSLSGTSITFLSESQAVSAVLPFRDDRTVEKLPGHLVQVDGKLVRNGSIFANHYAFLATLTKNTPKISVPAPTMLHFWGGRNAISKTAYPDIDAFWSDAIAIWRAEIDDLYNLGCRYVQIDDVTFPLICDPRSQSALRARGDDPATLVDHYVDIINRIISGLPSDLTIGIHMCRGNNRGKWMGSGGYDYISERVLPQLDVHAFFLEYDSERAGDFAPLRHLPAKKIVVLGLVSTKTPLLEKKDDLKRRVDLAAKVVPLDSLRLSPQCGFASNFMGNPVTIDDERRKLELVVETAREIWG